MLHSQVHVAAASLNQTVGDWSGNTARIREVIHAARDRGVRLLLLPEMCIPGYSLGDRVLRVGTLERSWDAMLSLIPETHGLVVAVGLPVLFESVLFNAIAILIDGQLAGIVAKQHLATGDVEYENRYYEPWPFGRCVDFRCPDGSTVPMGSQIFDIKGIGRIAFEICEDAWKGLRPGSVYALHGAEIILNPSASWFSIGKHKLRRALVEQISREDHCVYLYASLLGCDATRLIFDGTTLISSNGKILAEGRRFVFDRDWELIDQVVDLRALRHARMEEGSWREQHSRLHLGLYGTAPALNVFDTPLETLASPPAPRPYWLPEEALHPDPSLAYLEAQSFGGQPIKVSDLPHLEMELALCLGLRDYQRKTNIPAFCLALSGGRDSAMVATLIHRMFKYNNPTLNEEALREIIHAQFYCAYMGTENSSAATEAAARAIADDIGATFTSQNIQSGLESTLHIVEGLTGERLVWDNPAHDIPLQNLQARLRGMFIWTLANLHNALLLVTSNKSEAAVGYTTMDGDTSGGLAPIADVPKSLVTLYLAWAHKFHQYKGLTNVLALEASAELRPLEEAQTDEDDLMPFFVLDQLIYAFVQLGLEPLEILKQFWPSVQEHYETLTEFGADIRKFVRLFCFAQWKRERFAISFRVTSFDLDPKTGFRFPAVQAPFTEELADMDEYICAQSL